MYLPLELAKPLLNPREIVRNNDAIDVKYSTIIFLC